MYRNLHALANELADIIGRSSWTVQPPRSEDQTHYSILKRCDGLMLYLLRYDGDKRIKIGAEPLRYPDEFGNEQAYHWDAPSITVAATRTASSIASDIENRLIRDAESWFATALYSQQKSVKAYAALCEFRRQLAALPGAKVYEQNRAAFGNGWKVETRTGNSLLVFELPGDLIVKVLTAYHQIIENPPMTDLNQQQSMFPKGDDLPLFSGAPVAVRERHFQPKPSSAAQPSMLDLRPVFGCDETSYKPTPNGTNL